MSSPYRDVRETMNWGGGEQRKKKELFVQVGWWKGRAKRERWRPLVQSWPPIGSAADAIPPFESWPVCLGSLGAQKKLRARLDRSSGINPMYIRLNPYSRSGAVAGCWVQTKARQGFGNCRQLGRGVVIEVILVKISALIRHSVDRKTERSNKC